MAFNHGFVTGVAGCVYRFTCSHSAFISLVGRGSPVCGYAVFAFVGMDVLYSSQKINCWFVKHLHLTGQLFIAIFRQPI